MTDLVRWAALAPFLALAGAVINGLFGRSLRGNAAGVVASLAVAAGFVLSALAFLGVREVGAVRVVGYESKGKINKRIRIELPE